MKLSFLEVRWEPTPVPTTGFAGDWMKVRGNLFKGGQIIGTIPEFDFTIAAGPEPFPGEDRPRPSSWVIWKSITPVDVDNVILEVFGNNSNHYLVVDGKQFTIKGAGKVDFWTEYKFQIEPSRKWIIAPLAILGTIAVAALASKKR